MVADYGQFHIFGTNVDGDDIPDVYTTAMRDAIDSRRFVGTCGALVTVLTPGQYNFHTPVHLEVWPRQPPDDSAGWDHEVDVDLDATEGLLVFDHVGGAGDVVVDVPPIRYRARISGRGFDALGTAGANGDDSYRIRLFPRRRSTPPRLRKAWAGWAAYT